MDPFKIIIILGFVFLFALWLFNQKSRILRVNGREQGETNCHMSVREAVEKLESLCSEREVEFIPYPTAEQLLPEGIDEITKRFINDFGTVHSVYGDTTIGAKVLELHLGSRERIKVGESLADGLEYFLDEIGRSEVISIDRKNIWCILDRFPTIFHLVVTVCDV